MAARDRVVVLLLLAGVVACGGEDPPGPPAGGAGGTGGAAGAGGSGSDLCAKACASTATCDPQADVAACKAQCEKEVDGAGHLQAPVALGYFEQFAALENDQECLYSKGGFAWLWWTKNPDRIDQLPDQSVMQQCKSTWLACWGPTGTQDGYREACFMSHYRHNAATRAKVEACYSVACSPTEPNACVASAQPTGEPWLAGVEQPKLQ